MATAGFIAHCCQTEVRLLSLAKQKIIYLLFAIEVLVAISSIIIGHLIQTKPLFPSLQKRAEVAIAMISIGGATLAVPALLFARYACKHAATGSRAV